MRKSTLTLRRPASFATKLSIVCVSSALLATPPACAPAKELTVETVCQEAALAIASRTFACTDDAGLANARFDKFGEAVRCKLSDGVPPGTETVGPGEAIVPYHACGEALRNLACARVVAAGDDVGAWLRDAPTCAALYCDATKPGCEAPPTSVGGGSGGGGGGGGGGGAGGGGGGAAGGAAGGTSALSPPTQTAACTPVLDALRTIFERCGADPTVELANVDVAYGCDASGDAGACTSQLGLFGGCSFPSITVDGVLKTAGKCRAVLVARGPQ